MSTAAGSKTQKFGRTTQPVKRHVRIVRGRNSIHRNGHMIEVVEEMSNLDSCQAIKNIVAEDAHSI